MEKTEIECMNVVLKRFKDYLARGSSLLIYLLTVQEEIWYLILEKFEQVWVLQLYSVLIIFQSFLT